MVSYSWKEEPLGIGSHYFLSAVLETDLIDYGRHVALQMLLNSHSTEAATLSETHSVAVKLCHYIFPYIDQIAVFL